MHRPTQAPLRKVIPHARLRSHFHQTLLRHLHLRLSPVSSRDRPRRPAGGAVAIDGGGLRPRTPTFPASSQWRFCTSHVGREGSGKAGTLAKSRASAISSSVSDVQWILTWSILWWRYSWSGLSSAPSAKVRGFFFLIKTRYISFKKIWRKGQMNKKIYCLS